MKCDLKTFVCFVVIVLLTGELRASEIPSSIPPIKLDCRGPVRLLSPKELAKSFLKNPLKTSLQSVPQTVRGLRDAVRLFKAAEAETIEDAIIQLAGVENRKGKYQEFAELYDKMLTNYLEFREHHDMNLTGKEVQAERIRLLEEAYAREKNSKSTTISVALPYAPSDEGTHVRVQDTLVWGRATYKSPQALREQIKRERIFLNLIVNKYELELNITQALLRWHLKRFMDHVTNTSKSKLAELQEAERVARADSTSAQAKQELAEKREESKLADTLAKDTLGLLGDQTLMPEDWAVTYVENALNGSFHRFYQTTYPVLNAGASAAAFVWHGLDRVTGVVRSVGKPFGTVGAVTALGVTAIGAWATTAGYLQPYWDSLTKTPEQIVWRDHNEMMSELKKNIADPAESYEDFQVNFYQYFQPKSSDDALKIAMDYLLKRKSGLDAPAGREGLSREAQRLIEIQNILMTGYDSHGNRYFRGAQERLDLRRQNSTDFKTLGQAGDRGEIKFPLELPAGSQPVLPNKPAEPQVK